MEPTASSHACAFDRSPIAIVGISGRFPGADSVEALWTLLAEGRHGLSEVPIERWDAAARAEAEARPGEPPIGRWVGPIDDVERFDAAFFNISAREARSMDPQQRILLEEAWRAIEDAGVSLRALRRGRSSVYAGVMANDHQQLASRPGAAVDSFACLGSYACILANRLSYLLDLDGPSAAVEAACASSLIALQLAAQDIRRGACEFGIAAGVSLNLDPWKHVSFSKSRMLSPTGACLPFDVAADGYVPGDGVVVVLLERLDLALARGHHIHGVLRGVAVRHSGRTPSITAPSVAAQRAVLQEALDDAGVAPETVTYLEAHGTGTSLGDPIEVEALTQVYGAAGRGPVALGSVKANLGHLEAAAGLAGVARVLQMMRHRQIPPQARLKTLNPLIDLDHTPLTVARALTPWEPPPGTPRRASVSSFGFGGAISHAIIEEAPAPARARSEAGGPFVLSARSSEGLTRLIASWRAFSETPAFTELPLGDLLGTLATGREPMPHRVGFLARSHQALRLWLRDLTPPPPVEREESAWVLGALSWSGALLAPGDGASERTRRLYAAQAADPSGRVAALCALSALIDAGASPACVAGVGPGHDLALVLTGALDPSALDQPDAAIGRPDRPLWDPTRRALLAPRVAPPGYLGGLGSVEVSAEQAQDEARRALLLAQGQATFRGVLAERAAALREGGVELDPLLAKLAESPEEVSPELRALAFIACRASARRVRARWGLTERSAPLAPELDELVELVVDDVLPSDALISLILRGEERNRAVSDRLARLRPGAKMPRLEAWNDRLQEHPDGAAWRRAAHAAAAPPDGAFGARAVRRLDRLDAEAVEALALDLWRAGALHDWRFRFPEGSFCTASLPSRPFEGQRFRLEIPSPPQGSGSLSASPGPGVAAMSVEGASPLLRAEAGMATLEAYGRLGALHTLLEAAPKIGDRFAWDELRAQVGWVPAYGALADATRAMFVAGGLTREVAGALELHPDWRSPQARVAELGRLKAQLTQHHADLSPFLRLLDVANEGRVAVVTGRRSAVELYFADGRVELFNQVYQGNPLTDHYNALVAKVVREHLETRLAGGATQARVLEVGAGVGGTTGHVLNALAALGDRVGYTYTDVSPAFLGVGRRAFGAKLRDMEFKLLDLERPPAEQGLAEASYDAVVATNVLHATRDLSVTLSRVGGLLKPGGLLVANEITRVQDYWTLVTGLLDGWWLAQDPARRLPHGPLCDVEAWKALLLSVGFEEFRTAEPLRTRAYEQTVLVASARPIAEVKERVAPAGALAARLLVALRALIAAKVELDPAQIAEDMPLADSYGVDSLVRLSVVSQLQRHFGSLPVVLLYDHATLLSLRDHLLKLDPAACQSVVDAMAPETATPETATPETVPPVIEPVEPAQLAPTRQASSGAIAIVGLSGRFPGAPDVEALWAELVRAGVTTGPVPPDRWDPEPLFDPEVGKAGTLYTRYGGFLEDADCFDPLFFQISPRLAGLMDPQQRLFLEAAWSAVEDAGYTRKTLPRRSGVFAGVCNNFYGMWAAEAWARGQRVVPETDTYDVPNRVSFHLDLRGPSVAVDTACSASLSALHLAMRSLRAGECQLAIAGGVSLTHHPSRVVWFCQKGMLSVDAGCHPFGAEANGFVDGEGVVALVLKRLDDAIADGDHIHGVLLGSAINSGGRTSGYTVPSPTRQSEVVTDALADAGVSARSIQYVEAHGTGTPLGDPIEVEGLSVAFRAHTADRGFCALGSTKGNIGHLIAAAGAAGLTRVLLQLRHETIAPSVGAQPPNPHLSLERTPFRVPSAPEPWRSDGVTPRRAGVSSFGVGGSNAHLIVEEAPAPAPRPAPRLGPTLFGMSARDPERLGLVARRLHDALLQAPGQRLDDVAYTLLVGREAMSARLAVVASDREALLAALAQAAAGETPSGVFRGRPAPSRAAEAREPQVEAALARGDLAELARLWCDGASLPAERLTPNGRRVPLPTYPFARERHSLPLGPAAHPLLGEPLLSASLGEGLSLAVRLPGSHALLRDHRVGARCILPGAAFIDLALAAARRADHDGTTLSGVRWLSPAVADTSARLHLHAVDGRVKVRLVSAEGTTHAEGALSSSAGQTTPQAVALGPITRRCDRAVSAAELYASLHGRGVLTGPSLQVIEGLTFGDGEALGRLRPPPDRDEGWVWSPAVLDGALQVALYLDLRDAPGVLRVPAAVERVSVFGPATDAAIVYVVREGPGSARIDVLSGSGALLLRMEGARFEALPDPLDGFLWAPRWAHAEIEGRPAQGALLVVFDGAGRALADAAAQAHRGPTERRALDELTRHGLGRAPPEQVLLVLGEGAAEAVGHGPRAVATLVRALVAAGWSDLPLRLIVASRGACEVLPGDQVRPGGAGAAGALRSLPAEFPAWQLSAVDLDGAGAELAAEAEALLCETARSPEAVALRAGRRYVRRLHPLPLPAAGPPVAPDTTILITGGAGGIGLVLAAHAVQRWGAKALLLGRGALDPTRQAAVDALGPRALYLRADVANLAELGAAVAEGERRLGPVRGLFHGALTLRDGALGGLSAEDVEAVIRPKCGGAATLYALFGARALDFVVFFSSVLSLSGNPGQAPYSGACEAADSVAAWWGQHGRTRPTVLAWGHWGSVGAVAGAAWQERLGKIGLRPIRVDEGLDALERVIKAGPSEVAALWADAGFLGRVYADDTERFTLTPPATLPAPPTTLDGPYDEVAIQAQARAGALADEAASEIALGAVATLWGLHTPGDQAPRSRRSVAPGQAGLVEALLSMVESRGFVERRGDQLVLRRAPLPAQAEIPTLGAADPPWRALLQVARPALLDVMRGAVAGSDVLFPDASSRLVVGVYEGNPLADDLNLRLARALRWLADRAGRPLRVLELGAGTGATTAPVLAALAGARVEYTFTDVSRAFLATGQARFAGVPGLRFEVLDLEREPAAQGFSPGCADVVVATNVLHATTSLPTTLRRLRGLLAPGGWLALNELTARRDAATLTFGLLPGWWAATDGERIPGSPLVSPARWATLLAEEGLQLTTGLTPPGGDLGARVMLAVATGFSRGPTKATTTTRPVVTSQKTLAAPVAAHVVSVKPAAPAPAPAVNTDALEAVIRRAAGEALGLAPERLDPEAPFSDYGVDSIVGVDLIRRVNASLSLNLSRTVLFDRPSIAALAEHLVGLAPVAPVAPVAAAPNTDALEAVIRRAAGEALGLAPERIDPEAPFSDYGVDSIVGVDLIRRVNASLSLNLSRTILFDRPSIAALAEHLLSLAPAAPVAVVPAAAPNTDALEAVIRRAAGEALGLAPERLDPEAPFSDYGVDSIVGVDLIRRVNASLSLNLSRTVLFDRPSIAALAEHLLSLAPAAPVAPTVPAASAPVTTTVHETFLLGTPGPGPLERTHALRPERDPELGEHVVDGVPLLPSDAILELAAASARVDLGLGLPLALRLEIRRPAPCRPGSTLHLTLRWSGAGPTRSWALEGGVNDEPRQVVADGTAGPGRTPPPITPDRPAFGALSQELDFSPIVGPNAPIRPGPRWSTLRRLVAEGDWAEATLRASDPSVLDGRLLGPAMLDGALASTLAFAGALDPNKAVFYLPILIEEVAVLAPVREAALRATLHVRPGGGNYRVLDVDIDTPNGERRLALRGLHVQRLQPGTIQGPAARPPEPARPAPPAAPAVRATSAEPLAIIGLFGRFPGAPDPDAFWQMLADGRCALGPRPASRWSPGLAEGRVTTDHGGFLEDEELFDPLFFRISGREAELMDPGQRLFLETCWLALEDAGYGPAALSGQRVGVYAGGSRSDYQQRMHAEQGAAIEAPSFPGNETSVLAGRVSYTLNLRGPAIAVDTACSSSLVALHLAASAIRAGDCEMAIAGGVHLTFTPLFYQLTSASGMLAPDGRLKAFADDADGFVPGEAVGAVILKPLSRAQADGDRVLGVLLGTALNHDGRTNGLTAPSAEAQGELIAEALARAGVAPRDLSYVEAHGTGTKLGDPVEMNGLRRGLGAEAGQRPIGSVKTNIGHAAYAAGVAGVIKVLLAMRHGQIPASLNFAQLNSMIDAAGPCVVQRSLEVWRPGPSGQRIGSVSGFGIAGTNAFALLGEPPTPTPRAPAAPGPHLALLSGASLTLLKTRAAELARSLRASPAELRDLCFTLALGRVHQPWRAAVITQTPTELLAALDALAEGRAHPALHGGREEAPRPSGGARAEARALAKRVEALHGSALPETLAKLATAYLGGCDPEPAPAWRRDEARRVSLPFTPMERRRVPMPPGRRSRPPIDLTSPILGARAGDGFQQVWSGQDTLFTEHEVRGVGVMPGAASVGLLLALCQAHGRPAALARVSWSRPLTATAASVPVIARYDAATQALSLASGEPGAFASAVSAEPSASATLDLADRRRRLSQRVDLARFRQVQTDRWGVRRGPRLDRLVELYTGGEEALARIDAPIEAGWPIAPGLLDSAFLTILALPGLTDGDRTWAPFAAGRITLLGAPSARAWVWARREAPGRFTLQIADDDGRVFLSVEELALRPLGPATEPRAEAPLYAPSWTPAPPLPQSSRGGPVLLIGLAQAGSLGPALREALSGRDLYSVELGAGTATGPRQAWAALGSADAMRQAIGAMVGQSRADSGQAPEELLFLGGVRTAPGLNLAADLDLGPRALLHVLQAAAHHGLHRGLLRVITSDAAPVGPAGVQSPAGAALHGLARSAARELPELGLAVIDVAAADLHQGRPTARALAQAVLAEEALTPHAEVAIRGERRWVRGLQDLRLPPAAPAPTDGVALLVGGAGGIGVALSRSLVAQGFTRLAWIGRRPLDAQITEAIRAVESLGARVLYRAADAADAPALARAVAELSAALGPIRRAEHLGLTLADRSILRMSDAELLEPFRIKGAATLALYEALRGQPVAHLTLHSSGQSLVGLPGQANYAAASALQDALGLWLGAQGGPTVRVIGWGYWGQVGAVANGTVARHLAGFGILPMDQEEGLAAAAAISAGPVPHVFALRGTPELLRALGHGAGVTSLRLPPTAPEPDARRESAALARLDALAAELTRGALTGADLGDVAPKRARLLNTLRAVSRRAADRPAWQTHADLDALVRERPSLSAWRRLVEASARGVVSVLRGEARATDLLFPGGSTGLVEGVFADDAVAAACNRRIVAIVQAMVNAAGGAPVRIMEVGAGTGATARAVLEAVSGVEYVYTDLSERFLRHGRERLAGASATVRFEVFDAAKPAQDQGLTPGAFDVILASNVLHALPRLGDALKNLKRCLRPGGLLVINELVTVRDAVTLTFGLTDGWWLSEDGERLPDAPLLNIPGWRAALADAGFAVLEAVGPAPEQAVIVATHDGESAASAPPAPTIPEAAPTTGRPDALLWLREVLAEALRVPAEALRPDEGFERYGVDSLVTQELTRRLELDLGPLPSTLFFEFGTLARLAEHLAPRYAATLGKQRLPAPVAPPVIAPPATAQPVIAEPRAHADVDHAVAVIGLSGRYPHAPDLDALWSMLMSGGSGVEDLGPRLGGAAARGGVSRAAMIEESDRFDARFFRLPPSEAAQIDPQERLLLEQSWLALEHAGYAPNAVGGLNPVGVFVGAMNPGFERAAGEAEGAGAPNTASSSAWSFANRLSYLCDLQGPSLAVDTACSSGLTAVHLAMQSLRRGECRVAVVGAVNLIQTAKHLRRLAEAGMLSAQGRCSVFSAEADGFVDAEGVGALVLRPLRDAVAAGDTVYGVLLGSAMNSGGHTSGYTVPSPAAQAAVIQAALLDAGVPGEAINAVEAHGTGTRLGDPIEVAGLARALGPGGGRRVALRSLKANLGHMESAAGLAGLTRLVLELQHQTLTPSPHARPLNPKLGLEGTPLVVPESPAPWPAPRLAGVSSFGAGGTNVHVILGEAPPPLARATEDREQLILLSAPDDERLEDLALRMRDWLGAGRAAPAGGLQTRRVESLLGLPEGSLEGLDDLDELRLDLVELHRVRAALAADPVVSALDTNTLPPLEDVAFTSQLGRVAQTARLAILARDHQRLDRGLADFLEGRPSLVGRTPPPGQPLPQAPRGADVRGLAEAWVRGATVDWRPLWESRAPRRVALPTTRLLRTPCPPPGPTPTPAPTPSPRRRVAVLGAGPAGLATARCLLEEGFEPVIFERSDQIGGIWAFREGGLGGGYLSTRLQTSKYTSLYSDLAPPEDMDTFPTVPQLNAYLHRYSDQHALGERTRLNAEVQAVRASGGGWTVEVTGRPAERFDALAICTGAYWRPHLPQIPGLSRFRGRVIHSQAYHSPEAFAGQRVLVVGNGVSGMDIACDAAPVAARVIWSRRSARLILPRMFGYVPNDCALTPARRLLARRSSAEELIQEWQAAIPEHIQRLEATGLMPRFPLNEPMIHVNDHIVHEVFTGRVVARTAPVEVDESGVRFADGAYDAVDVIVLATGYEPPQFGMLPGLSLDALYDTSLHPDHPNLVVIGHKGASLAVIPTMELEARRWAASLSGRVSLPSPEVMRASLAKQRAAASEPGHAVFPRFESTLQNIGLAEIVGAWPSPAEDWELFWELLNLPPFPATYRLVGPHAWSGAREWLSAARGRMFVGRGDARLEGLRQELRREVGLD